MITRIVKMTFNKECINDFKQLFETHHLSIRNFDGNQFLILYQDCHCENIFFTYSIWDSLDALENYRQSDLFNNVWSQTKMMFDAKPEAWSLNELIKLS